jgi:hypothetical protein
MANRAFHKLLRDGVEVEYRRPDGTVAGDHVLLVDFQSVAANVRCQCGPNRGCTSYGLKYFASPMF